MDACGENAAETFAFNGLALLSARNISSVVEFTVVQLHHVSELLGRSYIFGKMRCGETDYGIIVHTVAGWHIEVVLGAFSFNRDAVYCCMASIVLVVVGTYRTNDGPTKLVFFCPGLVISAIDDL